MDIRLFERATEMRRDGEGWNVPGHSGPLQTATDSPLTAPGRCSATGAVPWRALVAASLLSLLLGAALLKGVGGERSSTLAGAHPGVSSQKAPPLLPAAALGPVSAALGAADPAYRVSASDGWFHAKNPAQRLDVRFGRSGIQVGARGVQVGLSLHALGYGTLLRAVGDVTRRVSANRVLYRRTGLDEWYVNGPLGLEQGFTLPRAPSGRSTGALTLAMTLSGDIHASVGPTGQSIALRGAGGQSLRYGALVATDARGKALRSWFELDGRSVLLRVDTRGARYPLRIDPLIQQLPTLTGGAGSEGALFGFSVALSADGNTALIGGRYSHGAAWVFTRSGSTWEQQGPPLEVNEEGSSGEQCGEEAVECGFSRSVALSADGDTALIGGPEDHADSGAVWVFTRSGTTWTQQGGPLTGGHETGPGRFGQSVALSADGNTALIGATADHAHLGAVWVFTRSGTTWTEQGAKITGGKEEAGDGDFGRSVALSSDGDTAFVGAPGDASYRGGVWVFTRSGTTWEQQGTKLTGGEEEIGEGRFGYSVALSAFAKTALIGARRDNGGVGAVWVFVRPGTTWKQQGAKLTGGEESGEGEFGYHVALSADGEVALIGGPRDNGHIGAAWLFTRPGTTWEPQGAKLAALEEGEKGWFGASVALSAGGDTALIGGPATNSKAGAAWAFLNTSVPPPTVSSVSPVFGSSAGGTPVRIEGGGFAEGAKVEIGGAAASSVEVLSETELTAVTSAHALGPVKVVVSDANGSSTGGPTYTYVPPPTVSSVSPVFGSSAGATPVTISGSGFVKSATTVEIGGAAASSVEVRSATELTAVTPAHAVGPVEVVVSDANGSSTGGPTYTYVPPPTVTSVNPVSGPITGATPVTIKGSGFADGAKVEIGGAASPVEVRSATELTTVTPAHAVGRVEVVVSDANGISTGGAGYTYLPPPTVSSVSPTFGSTAGATPVTIRGSGFAEGAKVEIGGVASPVEVLSETEITAVTPAHAVGPEEVVVSDAYGTSTGGPSYTYVLPPSVSSVSPVFGSSAGATPVTISGSGFVKSATTVEIGGVAASSVEVLSETELTAVTPAHAVGPVQVVVSDGNGTSTGGPTYTYVVPPVPLLTPLGGEIVNPKAGSGVLSNEVVLVGPPKLGVTGNLSPVSGKVLVKLPGSKIFVALTGILQVPFGTIVNATNGMVTVSTVGPTGALQTMTFYAGEFELTQGHSGVVLAALVGGNFAVCPLAHKHTHKHSHKARASSKHASGKHVVRKLWAEGHGSYSTKGSYAAGAVLGTRWLTEDLCEGTLIRVLTDSVEVTNLVTHRHLKIKAPHSYLAKAP